jgi:outer membrane protein assembly factor BamA
VGSSTFGTLFGIGLTGADVVGRHRWALVGNVGTERGYASYGASYSYNRFWPSLTLDTSRFMGVRGGIVEDGVRKNYIEENYGAGASIGLPVLRLANHSASASVGYRFNWFRAGEGSEPSLTIPGALSPKQPEVGILSGMTFGLSYSNLQRYTYSISTEKGRQVGVSLRLDHPSLGSDFQTTQFSYSWAEYVPMPWLRDHVLALRLAGGIGTGSLSRRGIFFIGGFPEQDVLRSIFDMSRVGGAYLRGYPQGVVYGDQYHLLNVEYRFPLFDIEKGFSTMPLYFTHLHAAVFADVGDAFFGDLQLSNLKVGVGVELLVEAVIGYFIPTTFRIGYARGLMEAGGNELHFLLGYPF